jgi:HEAT repeat protein
MVRASEERWRPRQGFSPRALLGGPPLVRGHAAWALGRVGTEAARQALSGRLEVGEHAWVREEAEGVIEP